LLSLVISGLPVAASNKYRPARPPIGGRLLGSSLGYTAMVPSRSMVVGGFRRTVCIHKC
jgi:hypothetical protein